MLSSLNRKYLNHIIKEDGRDSLFSDNFELSTKTVNPSLVDLEPFCGPVKNQGSTFACTSFAVTGMREFLYRKYYNEEIDQTVEPEDFILNPMFNFYEARAIEGFGLEDKGTDCRSAIKATNQFGCALISDFPNDITDFSAVPNQRQITNANKYQAGAYHRLDSSLDQIKSCLQSGYAPVTAFNVYESFESDYTAKTGDMLLPNTKTEKFLGSHAVLVIGYDDKNKKLKIRNSYGYNWGSKGNFFMSYKALDIPGFLSDTMIEHLGPAWNSNPTQ